MPSLELKIPPVALMLLAAAGMWALAWALPGLTGAVPGQWVIAAVLLATGLGVTLAAVAGFRQARTTVNPTTPEATSTVVTTGIYRWTRNPMYVGFLFMLAAWAVYLGNVAAAAIPLLFVAYMNRFQIAPEERALRARFGAPYDAYLLRVRRWL